MNVPELLKTLPLPAADPILSFVQSSPYMPKPKMNQCNLHLVFPFAVSGIQGSTEQGYHCEEGAQVPHTEPTRPVPPTRRHWWISAPPLGWGPIFNRCMKAVLRCEVIRLSRDK